MNEEAPKKVLITVTMTFPEWVYMKDYLVKMKMFPDQVKKIETELLSSLFVKKEDLHYE